MLSEDRYMERTPDLIAKVRTMRKTAEKEMNKFTRLTDYDVRCVVGHGQKTAPVSGETASPSPACEYPKKSAAAQISIEFASAPAEPGNDGENV